MNDSTQGQGLFEIRGDVRHIAVIQQDKEERSGKRETIKLPLWRAGPADGGQLPGTGLCSQHSVHAGNGAGYTECMTCCETLHTETASHQKACARAVFLALSKTLFAGKRGTGGDTQAHRLCLQKQSGQFNGGCLDSSWVRAYALHLGETASRALPKLLLMPWIADAPGTSTTQKINFIYWVCRICSAPCWKLRVCAPSHSACSQQKNPKSQTTENSKMIS